MKKRLLIVAGVILVVALAFGMGFWNGILERSSSNKPKDGTYT